MKRLNHPDLLNGLYWVVFLIVALTIAMIPFKEARRTAYNQFEQVTRAEWGATNTWLKSAECMRETGAWLVVCEGDRLSPIANHANADDPGFALILGLKSYFRQRTLGYVDVAKLHITTNYIAMFILAALMHAARARVAALLFLLLGGPVYTGWLALQPHPILIGIGTFAAILPLTLLMDAQGRLSRAARNLFIVVGVIMLAAAALFREPIGIMGFLVTIGSLIFLAFKSNQSKVWLTGVGLLAVFALNMPSLILAARDTIFDVAKPVVIETHGISHNLYLGLGVIENKFGIQWLDASGSDAVRAVDPTVPYTSPEYYQILWQQYWARVAEDPLEVLRIYSYKTLMVLDMHLPKYGPPLWVLLAAVLGFLALRRFRPEWWQALSLEYMLPEVAILLAFIGFFVLQGVIANPAYEYEQPIEAFTTLIFVLALDTYFRLLGGRSNSFPQSTITATTPPAPIR